MPFSEAGQQVFEVSSQTRLSLGINANTCVGKNRAGKNLHAQFHRLKL